MVSYNVFQVHTVRCTSRFSWKQLNYIQVNRNIKKIISESKKHQKRGFKCWYGAKLLSCVCPSYQQLTAGMLRFIVCKWKVKMEVILTCKQWFDILLLFLEWIQPWLTCDFFHLTHACIVSRNIMYSHWWFLLSTCCLKSCLTVCHGHVLSHR